MKPSNILKIDSLDDQWLDKDSVILHACFQVLKDVIEKEELLTGHTDWNADEKHRITQKEIQELYDWWITYNESDIPESEGYNKENKMLHRLIDIRWALWT